MGKNDNPTVSDRPLAADLLGSGLPQDSGVSGPVIPTSPVLYPGGNLPTKLSEGAAVFGNVGLNYFANGSAGNFTASKTFSGIDLLMPGFVWYLGAVDSLGAVVDTGAGLVNRGKTYASLNSEIYSGNAGCAWTKDTLNIYVKSTNTGYANELTAYFYYVFYYDDMQVKQYGL